MSDRKASCDALMADRLHIRELIDNWVLWRDTGDWERLAALWHPEGRMSTTWFQASGAEFVARSRLAWDHGMRVLHMLGGCSIDLHGPRAIAQTKMQIIQRAVVHGILVDVHCYGRFLGRSREAGFPMGPGIAATHL